MAHELDKGKQRFKVLVDEASEAKPCLPLVHLTDAYQFEEAISDRKLRPQPCTVFEGEALTYLFYGRPSFRPNQSAEPTSLGHYFPICLLFNTEFTIQIKRVFPFDSGAFQSGLYANHLHRNMKLGDFGLEPDASTPPKLISLFFGTVPSYLTGRTTPGPFDPAQFEAQSYVSIITDRDANSVDSRGSSIEVQTSEAIELKAAIAAVVMPSNFAEGSTGKTLSALGVDILPYRKFERMRPSEYMSEIQTLCMNYYIRKKFLREADL